MTERRVRRLVKGIFAVATGVLLFLTGMFSQTASDMYMTFLVTVLHIAPESFQYYALMLATVVFLGAAFTLFILYAYSATLSLLKRIRLWSARTENARIDKLLESVESDSSRLELAALYSLFKRGGAKRDQVYDGLSPNLRKEAKKTKPLAKAEKKDLVEIVRKGRHDFCYITHEGLTRLRETGLIKERQAN
jgi:hypothetical protein